ncbi:MAG: VanZ family protein [Rhodoglobus sp.]
MFLRHPILSLLTLGYLGLVAWITLAPLPGIQQYSLLWRLAHFLERIPEAAWFTFDRLEFLANIGMFIPLGLFFVLLLGRPLWWLALVLAVALTVGIEFAQQFIAGRVSDPRDLAANSIGATVGVLGALVVTAGKARRLRRAPRVVAQRAV